MSVLLRKVDSHRVLERSVREYLYDGKDLRIPIINESLDGRMYKSGIIMDVFYDYFDDVIKIARRLAEEKGDPVTCYKGCDICCHQPVSSALEEALLIYLFLRDNDDITKLALSKYDDWRKLAGSVEEYDIGMRESMIAGLSGKRGLSDDTVRYIEKYNAKNNPCPFLSEHVCTIYPVRPVACRNMLSLDDPEMCKGEIVHFLVSGDVNEAVLKATPLCQSIKEVLELKAQPRGMVQILVRELLKKEGKYITDYKKLMDQYPSLWKG
ncbi:MAG: YkgJ family cysteine cluster protein [Candidatus Aenigmatarchaeota archaeon]